MAAALMEDDVGRLHAAVGSLDTKVQSLFDKFEGFIEEQRKVHDIVVAQSEAVRNLDRDVREIKPLFEDYRLKVATFNETVELARDYRDRRAEMRGAWKLIIALSAAVGAITMIVIGELLKKWK